MTRVGRARLTKSTRKPLRSPGRPPVGRREDRAGRRATLITSQLPIEHWHDMIGDATFGDALLDRLVHHAHRLTLTGGSLRRLASTDTTPEPTD